MRQQDVNFQIFIESYIPNVLIQYLIYLLILKLMFNYVASRGQHFQTSNTFGIDHLLFS